MITALSGSRPQIQEDWKRHLVESVFIHKKVLLAGTLSPFVLAVGIVLFWPSTWAAGGSVLVRGAPLQRSPDTLGTAEARSVTPSDENIRSELQILSSPELIRRIVRGRFGLATEEDQTAEFTRIQEGLQAEVVPGTNVISIRLLDRDPVWAEATLDDLLRRYLSFRSEVFHPRPQEAFLAKRAESYRADLREAEDRLLRLSTISSVGLAEQEMSANITLSRNLREKLADLHTESLRLANGLRPLMEAVPEEQVQYFAFLNLHTLDSIASRLKELRGEYVRLARIYPVESPRLRALDAGIRATYDELRYEARKVLETRKVELEGLVAGRNALEESIRELQARNVSLQGLSTEMERVNREAGLLAFSYETFSKRAEEARINADIAAANFSAEVSILYGARNTAEVVFPQKGTTLGLGLLVGLVIGACLTLLMEFFDHTYRRSSDVNRFSRLPLLCSLRQV